MIGRRELGSTIFNRSNGVANRLRLRAGLWRTTGRGWSGRGGGLRAAARPRVAGRPRDRLGRVSAAPHGGKAGL